MALVDILIPTYKRKTGLAIVLSSLFGQGFTDFDVIVSNQTPAEEEDYLASVEIQTLAQALRWRGHNVTLHQHLPARGMAEQRQFLLDQSSAPYVHFIDDDVLLDPTVLQRMVTTMQQESCGFVGCAASSLAYLQDIRPHQQQIELWAGPVKPEPFSAEEIPWQRHLINNAANPLHLEQQLCPHGETVRYKVAWVGGANVLFDREKLLSVGGFSWWSRLPKDHAGEEVLAQFLLLCRYGGCGLLPCGTYHIGLPTTIERRERNATELFAELAEYYSIYDQQTAHPYERRARSSRSQ